MGKTWHISTLKPSKLHPTQSSTANEHSTLNIEKSDQVQVNSMQ